MSMLPDELRIAARALRRSPGFAAVSVASLGLAIGANTAVFSVVDAALFAPLPLAGAERIVRLWEERPSRGWSRFGVSAPAFRDWQQQAASLAQVAAYTQRSANLSGSDRPERVRLVESTADLFAVLDVRPKRGRFFTCDEETAGRDARVVLGFDFWRSAFAADPGVVGRTVRLDGVPHVVIGVLPAEVGAAFDDAQLWRPLALGSDDRRGARWLTVVGRLRVGVTLESARAELRTLARRQERDHPDTNTGWTVDLVPLQEARAEAARPLLVAVWAAVGLVLLVACANVASLMLGRASGRERELAVRAALGATPARLARPLAAEALLVAALGGVAGTLVALAAQGLLAVAAADALAGALPPPFDVRVFAFATLVTLATGLGFGVAPLAGARHLSLERALRRGRRGPAARLRARRGLVTWPRRWCSSSPRAFSSAACRGCSTWTRASIRGARWHSGWRLPSPGPPRASARTISCGSTSRSETVPPPSTTGCSTESSGSRGWPRPARSTGCP
jgi:predicted permease